MRGSLKQRYKGSWYAILEMDREHDPKTGLVRRRRKWLRVGKTRREAERRLNDLVRDAQRGEFVEPSKVTLKKWLPEWLEVNKARYAPSTYVRYKGIIENEILKAPIASLPLQKLRPSHIEQYYAAVAQAVTDGKKRGALSASTLTLHHAILYPALRKAVKDKLLTTNPAVDLDGKPRRKRNRSQDAQQHAWTATEARAFLVEAKAAGPQSAAFYTLALDSGARKGELCGLRWQDVELDDGKIRIVQQLTKPGATPEFGPPKTGKPRTISLSSETVELLRVHKRHQAALKMKNRTAYHDLGLAFAKEWADVRKRGDTLGQPLQANNLGQREYAKLIKAADVRPIKFHGLRHTCATLLLQAGTPVHVVSERLGHSKVSMTMEVYAHVLPDMQQGAAATMGAILGG